MSLINDALKRAKAAQATAPRAEEAIPHLRPVESAPGGFNGSGLVLPVVLTAAALGGLFFLWQAGSNHTQAANPAPATSNPPVVGTPSAASPSVSAEPGHGGTRPYQEAATPAPVAATVQTPTPAPSAVAPVDAVGGATQVAQPAAPVVTTPAPPRLQAIFYTPARPSAMISGKTVFVGDRVAGFQVAAITRESATLVGAGSTNLLSLER